MSGKQSQALAIRAIHGSSVKDVIGCLHTPIYNTTTFDLPSAADLLADLAQALA